MEKLAQGVKIGEEFGSPWGVTAGYHIGELTNLILTAAVSIAGIIVLFFFIFGGLKILAGAGKGDTRSTAEGKQAVTWAAIGFIIVFTTYWIIRVIEIIAGIDFITNPISLFGY